MGTGHWLWGGWGYKYFPSGNVLLDCKLTELVSCSHIVVKLRFVRLRLLECNLTELVSCSDILGTLVRLRFVRLPFY